MGRTPRGQTRERVLDFVQRRILAGTPPSVREVQRAFGFRAVQTARQHLEALVSEGRLAVERGQARGYRLPGSSGAAPGRRRSTALVPLLGRVQAGAWTLAVEDADGVLPVETRHADDALFALRVRGESMTGAGILPGDVVIVRRQSTARSGDVVVALVEDEATVKTLRVRGRRVELHPAHPDFEPIRPDREIAILGKVIEVRRSLD
ncbi:MAG: transcriptional repressor LexA [Proteobacteria bacterium]|nr:transcriptional repressor LexA [Pseudomonadota bacterium]